MQMLTRQLPLSHALSLMKFDMIVTYHSCVCNNRKTCLICGCSRDQHKREKDPTATMTYSQHLTRQNGDSSSSIDSDEEQKQLEKYTWYPPNISLEMVRCMLPCMYYYCA